MKKTILLAIALSLLLACRVQGISLVLGLKGGASLCSYFGPDYSFDNADSAMDNAWRLGFAAGAFCTIDFGSVFSLQPEVLLVRSGNAATEEASYWGPYEGSVRHVDMLTYLSIPLLLKLRLGNAAIYLGADARIRIGSGSARLKAEDKALQETFETVGLDLMSYSDDKFAPQVVAAVLGLEFGLPFRFLSGEWSLETRAEYCITNMLGESQGSLYNAVEATLLVNYGLRVLGSKAHRARRR